MQPDIFNEVVNNLNDLHKKWVVKTRFGAILSLNFNTCPVYWGYNLVKHFDPRKCCLKVGSEKIYITETMVKDILGFPKGNKKVEFQSKKHVTKMWRKQYGNKPGHLRVSLKSVGEELKNAEKLDNKFKLKFICFIITTLIEIPCNSFIRQRILGFCGNLDKCTNYNW